MTLPARPAPWTIGKPFAVYDDDDTEWQQADVTSGEELIARIYGPSPEVCLDRARRFVAAMQGWRPIEEAPRDGRWLLAHSNDRQHFYRISWGRDRDGRECWCSTTGSYGDGLFGGWIECPPLASQEERQPWN